MGKFQSAEPENELSEQPRLRWCLASITIMIWQEKMLLLLLLFLFETIT